MVGSDASSYAQLAALVEELSARNSELIARVEQLQAENARLAGEVAELERRLGQNSKNSSKPPSSDGLAKQAPKSLRRKSGRRPGKQPGSPGAALRQVDDPEELIDHLPPTCAGCGADLADAEAAGAVRRQVHDIPQITPFVVEHRLHKRRCACGCVTTATAPPGVNAPAVYGPNLRALAVYLLVFQHVPVARCAQLLGDVCGAGASAGWVHAVLAEAADLFADFEKLIKTAITLAHLVHFDETGVRVNGKLRWLHTACTSTLTFYGLHDKRGREAMDAFGILPAFTGIAVHDGLAAYTAYTGAAHARCNAHHLRELHAASEVAGPQEHWVDAALDTLCDLNDAAHTARRDDLTAIPEQVLNPLLTRWDHAILCGLAANPHPPGHRKRSKTRNLLERLQSHRDEVLRFAVDLDVPFTNNQAERDLRMVKAQLKISGCWRTTTGAKAWLLARSYISTVRKNGIAVLTALRDALSGNAWLPAIPATT